jgi:hypothetical protein
MRIGVREAHAWFCQTLIGRDPAFSGSTSESIPPKGRTLRILLAAILQFLSHSKKFVDRLLTHFPQVLSEEQRLKDRSSRQ